LVRNSIREYEPSYTSKNVTRDTEDISLLDLRHNGRREIALYEELWTDWDKSYYVSNDIYSPDEAYKGLKREIALENGVSISEIVFGHNVVDFLRNFLFCLIADKDEVVLSMPAPRAYKDLVSLCGGECVCVPCDADLKPRLELLISACNARTKVMLLNDPHYLSGTPIGSGNVSKLLSSIDVFKMLLIIDESEYYSRKSSFFREYDKSIIIRSLTKYHTVWGCGPVYAILPAPLAKEYDKIASIFPLPPAIVRGMLHMLKNGNEKIPETMKEIIAEREKLKSRLSGIGLRPAESNNFNVLFAVDDADKVWNGMLADGILITNGNDCDLPGYLIMCPGSPKENEQFLSVLGKVLTSVGH